jgi:hypothetical protein
LPYVREQRLPGFFRADAQVIYAWTNSWSRMRVSLEWMNLTLSEEALQLNCDEPYDAMGFPTGGEPVCEVEYAPAIFFPNIGIRAEF